MKEQIKLMLFEIIYKKLGLDEIEKFFIDNKIKYKEIDNSENYPILSKYFFLLNDIYFDNLSKLELETLKQYYFEYNQNKENSKKKLYDFLNLNLSKLLIPQTDEKYYYWGPVNFNYMAPAKSIVLAFHYIEFVGSDDEHDNLESIINNKLNYIQSELYKNIGQKVAVIKYNEVPKVRNL